MLYPVVLISLTDYYIIYLVLMLQKLQKIFTFDNKKMAHYILVYREPKIVYILEIIPPNYRLT